MEQRLGVRGDEWRPDTAALAALSEMGQPLPFFMETLEEESRTVEERQARPARGAYKIASTLFAQTIRQVLQINRSGAPLNKTSVFGTK